VALLFLAGAAPAMAAGRHDSGRKTRPGGPNGNAKGYRLDDELNFRASHLGATLKTRVIVELKPGATLPPQFAKYAKRNGLLKILNGQVVDLPNGLLTQLAAHPSVFRVHYDRPTGAFNYRTGLTTGTRVVQQTLGLDGTGIGVAVIDSGVTSWHDDLTNNNPNATYPFGNQRVAAFVDFVNGQTTPYDDYGHGSHVAGIIAGNGFDSNGQKAGAAPGASLVSLKVLDANGNGTISDIIAALDWVLANHTAYNIRVVNMSVGAAITESAFTDPLDVAAKAVVDAGVVVVGAAGNFGKDGNGNPQYGGISAPGNAPWVLTVGASSTQGTAARTDDIIGSYSSRGPTYLDWNAKPDLVAPGTGTVSLASPGSTFYTTIPQALLPGSAATAPALPYLSLTGTSMATPVVSGVVALMMQVNPSLTPNAVKAILQYTAQNYPGYDALTEGAGFLNAIGAVRLARFYATAQPGAVVPNQKMWSKHIIWGNHMLSGGSLDPTANAFATGTLWGVAATDDGDNIVWGTDCSTADCDNIVWGTDDGDNIVWGTDSDGDNIVWGTSADGDNIVWGTDCGGSDCDNIVWGTDDGDNIVWGTAVPGDNIVWGTAGLNADNIVWGTSLSGGDNIVWGTDDGDNIVWGTDDGDNIVWGTDDGDNIVWGTDDGDNIVWGTDDGDNIVWGTDDGDNIVWGTANSVTPVWLSAPDGSQTQLSGAAVFDGLHDKTLLKLLEYAPPPPPPAPPAPPDPPQDPPSDPSQSGAAGSF
jgi:serine protease AprX